MKHGPAIRCPHCGTGAIARTSKPLSPLYREIIYNCRNLYCGHVFVCGLEVVRTVSPSATPNAKVNIPLSSRINLNALMQQLSLALEDSKNEQQ